MDLRRFKATCLRTNGWLLSAEECEPQLGGRRESWLTGVRSVLVAIPAIYLFPSHPTTAKWLSDHDKYIAIERIRLNRTGTQNTRESATVFEIPR